MNRVRSLLVLTMAMVLGVAFACAAQAQERQGSRRGSGRGFSRGSLLSLLRLEQIQQNRLLTKEEYDDIVQSYRYLMNLRFIRQITAITEESGRADNFINPKQLSRIDQTMLKEIFKRIEGIQQKMGIEFTGIV